MSQGIDPTKVRALRSATCLQDYLRYWFSLCSFFGQGYTGGDTRREGIGGDKEKPPDTRKPALGGLLVLFIDSWRHL